MDMQKVGKFIQAERKARNMSQRDLGDYLSVTDKAVSKWERGQSAPDTENLRNMALLFNCNMAEIVDGQRLDASHSSKLPTEEMPAPPTADPSGEVEVAFDFARTDCISPFLFGDNLEHTRDSVNGGISAQMLKNRKFVGKPGRFGCASDWYRIGEKAYLTFGEPYTRHAEGYKMKRALECNSQMITGYRTEPCGIGQGNLCIRAGKSYDFALVAKAFAETQVWVRLWDGVDLLWEGSLMVSPGDYARYPMTLCPKNGAVDAQLEITFTGPGTLWIGAVSLMPSDNFHGLRPDVIEGMKKIGMKLLRWPGGNFAGEYNWKDGLLPRDMRAPFQSYLWLETQPHTHGYDFHEMNVDDFIALCREIGAEPFITINPTWNTPEESAEWVEYCNASSDTPMGKLRADRGHPEPYRVQFWSLGNEFGYGHMEGANSPADYARIVGTHAKEMLRVCPGLTLCSSGSYPNADWANKSAKPLAGVAPLVSLHHYAAFPDYVDPARRKEEYEAFLQKVESEFLSRIVTLREQLGDHRLKISFDEWNAWYAWYRGGSVTEGIFAAALQNMFFRSADKYGISLVCHFESVNEGAMQVFPDRVKLSPTGMTFSLMKRHAGGMVRALAQDVTATEKEGVLTVTLLNRSFDREKGFTLPTLGEIESATLYSAEEVVAGSEFTESDLPFLRRAPHTTLTLPPHSIGEIVIAL
ncbi:MAG: helix-turn-helix domain-containing protein [Clostridia bacterium]|nr:helix-turn-helix domain-containing protein [Clostridia bacterium]